MLAVTGITGHTGGHFLNELVQNNYSGEIRCLVRTAAKAEKLHTGGLNMHMIEGSLELEDAIRRLLQSADIVVHIAGIGYSPEIIRIGQECGVKRFVLVHTTGMYSKHKAASEGYCAIEDQIRPYMQDLNITIVRPTMIFGDLCDYNISKFIRLVDGLPILPAVAGGKALVQPVNARDLAKALFQVLQKAETYGKAYDLSGEKAVSVRQLYQMIAECLNKKRVIVGVPMWVCLAGAKVLKIATGGKTDIVEKVLRLNEDRAYTHEPATADFGYAPEAFGIGLKREVDAYRSNLP